MSVAVEQMLQKAFELHQAGDLSEAEQLYRASLAIDADNLNALQLFGVLNHQIGKHLDAVDLLGRAVALLEAGGKATGQHAALYNNLGNALRALGNGPEALLQYRKGLALNPDLAELHANFADELCSQGDFNGAIASYEAARQRGPLTVFRLCHLGSAYAVVKRFAEAESAYRAAAESIVKTATSGDGRLQKVANAGTAPLPTRGPASQVEGGECESEADPLVRETGCSRTIEPYRQLITAIPAHPDSYYLLGRALAKLGDTWAAIEMFRLGLEINPDYSATLYELGVSLMKAGYARLAIPYLDKAAKLKPDLAAFQLELGNALHIVGQTERALEAHRRAFRLEPVRTWKAKTTPAAFSVLAVEASGAGNTPSYFLLSDSIFNSNFVSLFTEMLPDLEMLDNCGDVIVNLISDVDQSRRILQTAAELIDRLGKPVINHPRRILDTTRDETAKRLAGIQFCRLPKTIRCPRARLVDPGAAKTFAEEGFSFPLLLRVPGSHGGDAFDKVSKPGDVAGFLDRHPVEEFYVTEFMDYRSLDGYFRKYRFIFIEGEIFPYHLAIGDCWKLHHFKTDMVHHLWMQEEEKAFLEYPWRIFSALQQGALRSIAAAIDLEFFGIDCSIDSDKNVVVFEVNASMLVHDDNAALPYKTPHCVRIKQAYHDMLARAAGVKAKAAA